MAKPMEIQLPDCDPIPIIYEDRSLLAIDKPAGWMLLPLSWQKTQRNLLAAISSSLLAGDFWARSRNLKFLRFIHRLDGDTSGVMLFAKSMGALETFSDLFAMRRVEKVYLAVTDGAPKEREWKCELPLAPDATQYGRVRVDPAGKLSETAFRHIASAGKLNLIECRPITGRQHQIRVHLLATGCPILGDKLYGPHDQRGLALRAIGLAYWNPFTRQPVGIRAELETFLRKYGFARDVYRLQFNSLDQPPDWRIRRDDLPELDEPDEEGDAETAAPAERQPQGERRELSRAPRPQREGFRPPQRSPRSEMRQGPRRPSGGDGWQQRDSAESQSRPPRRPFQPRRGPGPDRGPRRPPRGSRPPGR